MTRETSSIDNPIEIMASIVSQFADKFVKILTYQTTGDKDKLIALAKRRAEFILDNF